MPRADDLVEEARANPGCLEPAQHDAVGVDPGLPEAEDFLHGDDVAFHAAQFAQR